MFKSAASIEIKAQYNIKDVTKVSPGEPDVHLISGRYENVTACQFKKSTIFIFVSVQTALHTHGCFSVRFMMFSSGNDPAVLKEVPQRVLFPHSAV